MKKKVVPRLFKVTTGTHWLNWNECDYYEYTGHAYCHIRRMGRRWRKLNKGKRFLFENNKQRKAQELIDLPF